jgi:hypothetical protein
MRASLTRITELAYPSSTQNRLSLSTKTNEANSLNVASIAFIAIVEDGSSHRPTGDTEDLAYPVFTTAKVRLPRCLFSLTARRRATSRAPTLLHVGDVTAVHQGVEWLRQQSRPNDTHSREINENITRGYAHIKAKK